MLITDVPNTTRSSQQNLNFHDCKNKDYALNQAKRNLVSEREITQLIVINGQFSVFSLVMSSVLISHFIDLCLYKILISCCIHSWNTSMATPDDLIKLFKDQQVTPNQDGCTQNQQKKKPS